MGHEEDVKQNHYEYDNAVAGVVKCNFYAFCVTVCFWLNQWVLFLL